jgi:hypothetical protein
VSGVFPPEPVSGVKLEIAVPAVKFFVDDVAVAVGLAVTVKDC